MQSTTATLCAAPAFAGASHNVAVLLGVAE